MKIKEGDKVVLNSLLDFSQEVMHKDWTPPDMKGKVLPVLWCEGSHINLGGKYLHARNRFALVHNGGHDED